MKNANFQNFLPYSRFKFFSFSPLQFPIRLLHLKRHFNFRGKVSTDNYIQVLFLLLMIFSLVKANYFLNFQGGGYYEFKIEKWDWTIKVMQKWRLILSIYFSCQFKYSKAFYLVDSFTLPHQLISKINHFFQKVGWYAKLSSACSVPIWILNIRVISVVVLFGAAQDLLYATIRLTRLFYP